MDRSPAYPHAGAWILGLSFVYSSLQLKPDFSAGDRTTQLVTSDLTPNSLAITGCFTNVLPSSSFSGHRTTGLFVRDPLAMEAATLYRIAPPLP